VRVGAVYRVRTVLTNPPKEKIVLYVGDGFFLWFNTNPRHRPAQMLAKAKECPEIQHDCYLDCGRVTVFSESEIAAAKVCGEISLGFATKVVEEIEVRATVMVGAHRKIVAGNLRIRHPTIPAKQ
jgi:hypothetical protein